MNYAGRKFRPVNNTPNGEVGDGTLFHYEQQDDLFSATYAGGGIRHGQMLGLCDAAGHLRFCYQHVSDDGSLRSGVCESRPEILEDGRIRLHERWRWTHGAPSTEGESVVEEVMTE
jgi:hypothetical protein